MWFCWNGLHGLIVCLVLCPLWPGKSVWSCREVLCGLVSQSSALFEMSHEVWYSVSDPVNHIKISYCSWLAWAHMHMCVYVCVCVYVCIPVYGCACLHMCTDKCVCLWTRTCRVCVCVCVCIHVCVCVHVCVGLAAKAAVHNIDYVEFHPALHKHIDTTTSRCLNSFNADPGSAV